jgi:hypothetical protein
MKFPRAIAVLAFVLQLSATGQQAAPPQQTPTASNDIIDAVLPLDALEKQFQESLSDATLTGFYTVGDSPETKEDRYTIERVAKIGEDLWAFQARIAYNNREFKATVKVPVKWAGETPVLTLSNYVIKDQGVFSARILIHNGMYAGTWGAQAHGGKMFGKIVKNESAPK